MKVVCAWCRHEGHPGFIGELAPLDDSAETHGICQHHSTRVLEHVPSPSFPGVRLLIIVAPSEPALFRYLERAFATAPSIHTIIDRRRGDRRAAGADVAVERRRSDRRIRIADRSPLGYHFVRFGAGSGVPAT
jgi:hypothetical protein